LRLHRRAQKVSGVTLFSHSQLMKHLSGSSGDKFRVVVQQQMRNACDVVLLSDFRTPIVDVDSTQVNVFVCKCESL
jgi:hypothetical protein